MIKRLPLGSALLITGIMVSCGQQSNLSPEGTTVSLQGVKYDDAIYREIGIDGEFARFAQEVPGFGGMWVDEDGQAAVWMKNPGRDAKLMSMLNQELSAITRHRVKTKGNRPLKSGIDGIIIKKAAYDYRDLVAARMKIRSLLGQVPITMIDIQEDRNKILVGVDNNDEIEKISALFKKMDLPAGMIQIEVYAQDVEVRTLQERANPTYPLVGGLQISGAGTCSLGVNAYVNGVYGFLTASHCASTIGTTVTTSGFYQPSFNTSHLIGYEQADPPAFACAYSAKCRYSDTTFVAYNPSVSSLFGALAKPVALSSRSNTNLNIYDSSFLDISDSFFSAALNDTIYKIGRTTGYQSGRVTNTCYDSTSGASVVFLCQTKASVYNVEGDSGGPVFSMNADGTVNYLGNTSKRDANYDLIYSPIGNFRADMGGGSSVVVN